MTDFNSIFSPELKNTYNSAIDALLADNGLSTKCILSYSGEKNNIACNNCVFDPISRLSANLYNGSGPKPFPEHSICPVCMGMGQQTNDAKTDIVYLAVLFDSRYWLKWSSDTIKIPDGMIQTICLSSLLPKIRSANDLTVDPDLSKYGSYVYERAGDPKPVGFGSNRYIFTMWQRK